MDTLQLTARVRGYLEDVTQDEVLAKQDSVDINREQLIQDIKAEYVCEVWDRVSSVNGAPPELVVERSGAPRTAEIILIRHNGVVTFLQSTDPTKNTPIPPGQGLAVGGKMIDIIANDRADDMFAFLLAEAIRSGRSQKHIDLEAEVVALREALEILILDSLGG